MGLYKNGGVSTGFCPSIVTWKTRSWKIISLNSFIPSAKCSVQCVESCDSFQLIQFHSKSMPKLGNFPWFCFQVRFTSWVSLLLLSVHERPRPAVMRRARSIGIYIAMPSNAIIFFLKIHQSKSWKWRIEPLAASYQFKDSFLSPSSHNFSMLRLQCSLLGLELECLKPCRVSYDFTKQTPAGAQGEWMLRPEPMTSAFRVFHGPIPHKNRIVGGGALTRGERE